MDTEALAAREQRSKRSVHMMISTTFVAPDVVEALIAGRLPRGISITRPTDLPPSWVKQRKMLGISNRSLRGVEPVSTQFLGWRRETFPVSLRQWANAARNHRRP
jgi:hypothetical protein